MNQLAQASALEGATGTAEGHAGRYLTFQLASQAYGIAILVVREIIALQEITPVTGCPSYVEGVINLRGRIIPIVDLRVRLQFPRGERTERTCIIVTEVEGDEEPVQVGCIVDTVSEVLDIEARQIEGPPELGQGVELDSLVGLAKLADGGRVVSLLDIEYVLRGLRPAGL